MYMPLHARPKRNTPSITSTFDRIDHLTFFIQRHIPHIMPCREFRDTLSRGLAAEAVENPEALKHIHLSTCALLGEEADHVGLTAFREALQRVHYILSTLDSGHKGRASIKVGVVVLHHHLHDDAELLVGIAALVHLLLQFGIYLGKVARLGHRHSSP